MAENSPTPQPAAPAAKPRNPVEKVLVRGFIVVALILIGVEANSWWQQKSVLNDLLPKVSLVEKDAKAPAVTEADVKKAVGNKQPDKTRSNANLNPATSHYGASRVDVYSWFTISPVNKREMYVYYGKVGPHDKDGPEVLSIQTDDTAPEKLGSENAASDQAAPPPGGPGMAGGPPGMTGGGPGMMGGGRGRPSGAGHSGAQANNADKPGEDKPGTDKAAEEKPADEKPADAKSEDAGGDARSE